MAHGISTYLGNSWMNALGNATSFSVAVPYVKLHTGDPGAAGTLNPAVETTRKSISFGVSTTGALASDADISWTNIAGSEDATHFTVWDASTAGNFLFSGSSNKITPAFILVDSSADEQEVNKLDDKRRAITIIAVNHLFLTTITLPVQSIIPRIIA